jgi:YfiH family protein
MPTKTRTENAMPTMLEARSSAFSGAFLRPDWPAPANVVALTSTRIGGASTAPFNALNLGDHVGDEPAAVVRNRQQLVEACPGLAAISWLEQVHGVAVVAAESGPAQRADAQFTAVAGLGCAVMTADCLPVLFCDYAGTRVAAAHAGWRGLRAGVVEATVATFPDPAQLLAWLGPAIGPVNFEVGAEVRTQFIDASPSAHRDATAACFTVAADAGHFLADIYELARLRLRAVGVTAIYGGGLCTVADPQRFYSYRRDGVTGRMASLIYLMADTNRA